MKTFSSHFILLLSLFLVASCMRDTADYGEQADELAHEYIIVDGHVDLPYRLKANPEDVSGGGTDGNFDFEKAQKGGLNAPFMSIYIPARYQQTGGAMDVADSLISIVRKLETDHPKKFAVAASPQQIKEQFENGLISLPMGLENGAPVGNDINNVKALYDKGIRYITLAHSRDNQISDSSYDTTDNTHGGLSDFGEEVVKEMNKVGIMVDISHVTDSAFYDVIEVTEAPVIASHSSARYYTPEFERNMSDTMITMLAENNGVMMINFGSNFISDSSRTSADSVNARINRKLEDEGWERSSEEAQEYIEETWKQNYHYATVSNVADHFEHVVNLVGIDHVGFGSDYDGVGDTLPIGMKDASTYPTIIEELMKRGYTKDDIRKISHENIFRVWREVEETAQRLSNREDEDEQ